MRYLDQFKINFKPTQLQIFLYFLIIYSVCAAIFSGNILVMAYLLYLVIFNYLTFLFFRLITKKNKIYTNSLITVLILFLVYHYNSSFIGILAISLGILAIHFYKNFLYIKNQPWLNPAVVGILSVEFINWLFINTFKITASQLSFTSWWGADFGQYASLVLIAIWAITGLYKWRKHKIFLIFLITTLFLYSIIYLPNNYQSLLYIFSSSTIYFFASIMLVEPKTTPIKDIHQIIYAVLAGIMFVGLSYYGINNSEIITLLIVNLFNQTIKTLKL